MSRTRPYPVQGPEIGDDHLWWFHRTFHDREPGGRGKAMRSGYRSQGRELRSDGSGKSNSAVHYAPAQYVSPHLLAIALLGLGEAGDLNNAAKLAVLHRRGMGDFPDVFQTWLDDEANAPEPPKRPGKSRSGLPRLSGWRGDALREYRRINAALCDEAMKRGLWDHITWLRANVELSGFLSAEKTRLIDEAAALRSAIMGLTERQ